MDSRNYRIYNYQMLRNDNMSFSLNTRYGAWIIDVRNISLSTSGEASVPHSGFVEVKTNFRANLPHYIRSYIYLEAWNFIPFLSWMKSFFIHAMCYVPRGESDNSSYFNWHGNCWLGKPWAQLLQFNQFLKTHIT